MLYGTLSTARHDERDRAIRYFVMCVEVMIAVIVVSIKELISFVS